LTPALVLASQGPLDRSVQAFKRGDCARATDAALDSLDALPARAEPWEILGYCDARAGQLALAVRAMDAARARDPNNWQYAYGQALVRANAGADPLPYARAAAHMNPLEPLARELLRRLSKARTPARRAKIAARAGIPFQ
jgi:cytochrome c-type biogenesis protein CcmH/NrfG